MEVKREVIVDDCHKCDCVNLCHQQLKVLVTKVTFIFQPRIGQYLLEKALKELDLIESSF